MTWLVPYLVFTILLLNFSAVDLKSLTLKRLDGCVMLFQTAFSIAGYLLLRFVTRNEDLAQGAMICVLCPVASSVVVVASALGADRRVTTGYTIYGNLLVAIVAPIFFSFIGQQQQLSFFNAFSIIFAKIAPVIALPFFIAAFMQWKMPTTRRTVAQFKEWALPLWALALLITLGRTIDYIFHYHVGNERTIIYLALIAFIICILQFALGRLVGNHFGQSVATGQLFGQKNTGIGIWMASIFLNPLSTVALAFYSIAQNIFNSWQMWHFAKQHTAKNE